MKDRAPSTTGFEHDRPYMKLDLWEVGEIEKKFGHDPATYPNQDLLQHYPTIQFNPGVITTNPVTIDSNLNVHTMPNQPTIQTTRPGFMNVPTTPHNTGSLLKVSVKESNDVGIANAVAVGAPTIAAAGNKLACPSSKATTTRPGFMNEPASVVNGEDLLPASSMHSNPEGLKHALGNNIAIKDGYVEICDGLSAPTTILPTTIPPIPGIKPPIDTCGNGGINNCDPKAFDGGIDAADRMEDSVSRAVDDVVGTTTNS